MLRDRCPWCGGSSAPAFIATDRNRETTAERFPYRRCQACSTTFLAEIPANIASYYPASYHDFGPDGEPTIAKVDELVESEEFRIRLLREHVEPGALIEIGAGTGGFARAARAGGFDVTAIEMDARCCQYLNERLGVTAINSDDPMAELTRLAPPRVIAMWHVLEHLPEPRAMVELAAERLEPGGVLALGIPNADSLQFRLFSKRWMHLDAPRHLSLIPLAALLSVTEARGLECLALTTSDPFGRFCDRLSWDMSVRQRTTQPASLRHKVGTGLLSRIGGPFERRGLNGTVLTAVLRKRR